MHRYSIVHHHQHSPLPLPVAIAPLSLLKPYYLPQAVFPFRASGFLVIAFLAPKQSSSLSCLLMAQEKDRDRDIKSEDQDLDRERARKKDNTWKETMTETETTKTNHLPHWSLAISASLETHFCLYDKFLLLQILPISSLLGNIYCNGQPNLKRRRRRRIISLKQNQFIDQISQFKICDTTTSLPKYKDIYTLPEVVCLFALFMCS